MISLEGKNIALTGGASGIGRATAKTLAEAGARVFIGDLNAEGGGETVAAIESAGGKADFLRLDVTDDDAIAAFASAVQDEIGGAVDVVVNVAGWDRIEPFVKNPPGFLEQVVAINYMGPVKVTRAFLDGMIAAEAGKIVSVSSDAGRVGSMGETVYAGAKGGIIAFTKSLAREVARHQINVNCVCPGPTDTPLLAQQSERVREALIRATPLRRPAKPEEIADAILFFASNRADFITGQVLSVSGGLTMVD
jgi:2-hydroxycyclohexanecarboxyl-CoA dehydrogenase